MYCAYCGVHYGPEDACLCLPPESRVEMNGSSVTVKGPWGETVAEWSAEPVSGEERWRFLAQHGQA